MFRHLMVAACLALVACSSPFKADGASCPASVCSGHGECTYQNTFPSCACASGYDGVVCSRCAAGFHRGPDDACLPDQVCTPGACGANGVCQIDQGLTVCACGLGFGGVTCDTCRAGYHAERDGGCALDQTCLPSSCADAGACTTAQGRVSCTCPPDRGGSFCEVRMASCAMGDPCGANGRCVDETGTLRCSCVAGYSGPRCDRCSPGYLETDAGCSLAPSCTPSTCSFSGSCSGDAGTCACDVGYSGASCNTCAPGFHRDSAFACVADETCTAGRCSANGACRVQGGVAVCDCQTGSAGLSCETCYPGYHAEPGADGGSACVLDATCRPETCRFRGTCAADAGVVRCTCDTGYRGSNCETNSDDCVNSACNGSPCVDLINSNVCLCDGGVFGVSCP
jgi:hypothetical protein